MAGGKKQRTELDLDDDIPEEEAPPAPPEEEAPREEPDPKESAVEEESEGEPRFTKKKIIIIASASFGALLLIGGLLFFFLSGEEKKPAEPVKKIKKEPAPIRSKTDLSIPNPNLYTLEPFIVKLKGDKENRFMRASFAVMMNEPDVIREIERNLVLVRENIYELLLDLDRSAFTDPDKKEKNLVKVAIAVNRSIQAGAVTKAYLTELTVN